MPAKYTPEQRLEAFWARVDKTSNADGCWLWTGGKDQNGYGRCRIEGRRLALASHVSYELAYGPIPKGLYVLHNCPNGDNPACVNPGHLWLGTQAENMADMWAKGRSAHQNCPETLFRKGEDCYQAKFTESDVREIRTRYATGGTSIKKLATAYKVAPSTIWFIVTRKTWAHVLDDGPAIACKLAEQREAEEAGWHTKA